MATEPRFRSMLLAVVSFIVLSAAGIGAIVEHMRLAAADHWPDWKPDATAALALDRMAHAVDIKPLVALQRAKSFLERALNHPWFTAGHFDPGRDGAASVA
jgi:hypothetical protein